MNNDNVTQPAAIVIDTPEGIAFAQFLARKSALRLEIMGMRMSRGISVYAICKREYGLKGSKQRVFDQMEAIAKGVLDGSLEVTVER